MPLESETAGIIPNRRFPMIMISWNAIGNALMSEQLLEEWQREMDALCKLAGVKLVQVMLKKNNDLGASIDGSKAYFGRQILQTSPTIRHYVMAHELGHKISFHEKWFWFTLAIALLLGFMLIKLGGIISVLVAIAQFILLIVSYSYIRSRWMVLEWQADAAGASLLAKYLSSDGYAAMLQGMTDLRDIRIAADPKWRDWHVRFYASKINKLSGNAAQAWVSW